MIKKLILIVLLCVVSSPALAGLKAIANTGSGGSSGPTVKNAAGTTLSTSNTLQGGAATTGSTVGFAQLDASGNLVGTLIPRTGTLSSLQSLAGTSGELGSATNTPAVVQFTGTAPSGAVATDPTIYPYRSAVSYTIQGSGAVTDSAFPTVADIYRITAPSGVTSFTATLNAGSIDGQEVTLELMQTNVSFASLSVNGTVVATTTAQSNLPYSAAITITSTVHPPVRIVYKWNATAAAWALMNEGLYGILPIANVGAININPTSYPYGISSATGSGAISIGASNTVSGINAAAIGLINAVGGQSSFAIGQGSNVSGGSSIAVSSSSTALYGSSSVSIGGNFVAGGQSVAIGQGNTGNVNDWVNGPNYVISSASLSAGTYTATVSTGAGIGSTAELEAGETITVLIGGVTTSPQYGTVTGVTSSTVFTFTLQNYSGAVTANSIVINNSDGELSTAIGVGASTRNATDVAFGGNYFLQPGDEQYKFYFAGQTTSSTTPAVLTWDNGAANTKAVFGNSNRFITEVGKAYEVEEHIIVKVAGGNYAAEWTRKFMAVNQGGTLTCSSSPATTSANVIGSDLYVGTQPTGTTGWQTLATVPFSISCNSTYKSIDTTVTGTASNTFQWFAVYHTHETQVQ